MTNYEFISAIPMLPPINQIFSHKYSFDERNLEYFAERKRYATLKSEFDRNTSMSLSHLELIKSNLDACINDIHEIVFNSKNRDQNDISRDVANYEKRQEEIRKKINLLTISNGEINESITSIAQMKNSSTVTQGVKSDAIKCRNITLYQNKYGYTIESLTNIEQLHETIRRLSGVYEDLKQQEGCKYRIKEDVVTLKVKLSEFENRKEKLKEKNNLLKFKLSNINEILESIQTWQQNHRMYESLDDAIEKGFKKLRSSDGAVNGEADERTQEDDPINYYNDKIVSDYRKVFNDMLFEKKYREAALHAAKSPFETLRTKETLEQFEAVSNDTNFLPVMYFFEALLSTIDSSTNEKLDHILSIECVKWALWSHNHGMINHCLEYNKLTLCEELGDIVANHSEIAEKNKTYYLSLAQSIYHQSGSKYKALQMLLNLRKYKNAIAYAEQICFTNEDYLEILKIYPEKDLGIVLWKRGKATLEKLLNVLLIDNKKNALALYLDVINSSKEITVTSENILSKILMKDNNDCNILESILELLDTYNKTNEALELRAFLLKDKILAL